LATALSFFGSKVLLIDGDFINPSVAFHMGLEGTNTGVRAVLTGKSTLANATVVHGPTGISVLPGEIKANMHIPTASQFDKLFEQIANTSYNFVILDTPPGSIIEAEEHVKSSGEAIIITTPEISACTSAARLANHYDKIHLKHGLIVNKFKNKRYELHVRGIEEMYDGNILGVFPDDE
ncbi:MAG: AAA family ATPase, partial [Candidatus Micrarchaeota archaeon]|nr:AAA family ATPase [Candidatus Micrarchaeota archaeon]